MQIVKAENILMDLFLMFVNTRGGNFDMWLIGQNWKYLVTEIIPAEDTSEEGFIPSKYKQSTTAVVDHYWKTYEVLEIDWGLDIPSLWQQQWIKKRILRIDTFKITTDHQTGLHCLATHLMDKLQNLNLLKLGWIYL